MRKYSQFKREEKAVLAIGILMIATVLTAGPLEQKFVRTEAYVPLKEEQQSVNAIIAKKEAFIIEQNAKLSQKTKTYASADPDVLEKVKLDLSAVDTTTPGIYQTVAFLQKECASFAVKVVENVKSVIQAAHMDFQFAIESGSTVQEVRDYASVAAADVSGNDLSALITGQDGELPVEAKTVTYQLSVEDTQGQCVKKSVRVQYLLSEKDKKDQY